MDESTKISLLKDEYTLLQNFYEKSDQTLLKLKIASATISFGLIGTAFYKSPNLWLFASFTSLFFWLMDALWKSFQYLHANRIIEIEKAFRENTIEQTIPLQIYSSWFSVYYKDGMNYWRNFFLSSVFLPHLLSLIISLVFFALGIQGFL